jgi:hypothetical protein
LLQAIAIALQHAGKGGAQTFFKLWIAFNPAEGERDGFQCG